MKLKYALNENYNFGRGFIKENTTQTRENMANWMSEGGLHLYIDVPDKRKEITEFLDLAFPNTPFRPTGDVGMYYTLSLVNTKRWKAERNDKHVQDGDSVLNLSDLLKMK